MSLDKRQLKIGFSKAKDRYLYNEIICNVSKIVDYSYYPVSVQERDAVAAGIWDNVENDLLRPNKLVSSKMKDATGRNILHHACDKWAPEYIIDLLVDSNRIAIQTKDDNDGTYPLFLAMQYEQPETVVLQLLQAFPEASKNKDSNGYYPLHLACRHDQSETVVFLLLKEFPEALKHKDDLLGRYPLHEACVSHQSEAVILKLLTLIPKAAQLKDNNGWYPRHLTLTDENFQTVVHE